MNRLALLLSLALVTGFAITLADAQQRTAGFPSGTIVDLSYAFDSSTVYWPTAETFHLEKDFEGITDKGYYYSAYRYSAAEHGGTHIDAPVHFAKGHNSVDEIPLDQLLGPGVVVDVAYLLGFYEKRSIDHGTTDPNNLAGPTALGSYSSMAQVLTVSVTLKF